MSVHVPASWAASGYVPDICVAHGQPTEDRTAVRFHSRPPLWVYPLFVLGGLILAVIAIYAVRKTVHAVWPYCPSCRALRARNVVLALMLLAFGGLGVTLGVVWYDGSALAAFLVVGSSLCLFVGALFGAGSSRTAIGGAVVTRDGQWLEIPKPAPAFAAAVSQWVAAAEQRTTTPAL